MEQKVIDINVPNLRGATQDPVDKNVYHLEVFLPFSTAAKLPIGNANVRPPSEKKPLRDMLMTIEVEPTSFHRKNRGITYICEAFEVKGNTLELVLPTLKEGERETRNDPKFGIADGGHTMEAIVRTLANLEELKKDTNWTEPFVKVHFVSKANASPDEIKKIVEALNTSSQVQLYTLNDYQHKFDGLKQALTKANFPVNLVSFREGENKEYSVIEVIQRLSVFLKDRWIKSQPMGMYKSKSKALALFTNPETNTEFKALYDIIGDIITLPEFIESELSKGEGTKGRRIGKLRSARVLDKPYVRPGTDFETNYRLDMSALLPMASAFRELLTLKDGKYVWSADPKQVFKECATDLYDVLVDRSVRARTSSQLGSDPEYWAACSRIVMKAASDMNTKRRGVLIRRRAEATA